MSMERRTAEQLAHSIHHECIQIDQIDQAERAGRNIDWREEYFKVLALASALGNVVIEGKCCVDGETLAGLRYDCDEDDLRRMHQQWKGFCYYE